MVFAIKQTSYFLKHFCSESVRAQQSGNATFSSNRRHLTLKNTYKYSSKYSTVTCNRYLRSLKHRDRRFESHSRHRRLSAFDLCLCRPVQVAALRGADHQSTGSYQPSIRFIISQLILNGNRPDSLIPQGGRRRSYCTDLGTAEYTVAITHRL
jgi:hypothetical protein